MNSGCGNRLSKRLGFPIRKSPDQSLVADSPRHIAGSHVLHRLLMPRHPPYALKNLITLRHKKIGMNSDTRPEINYTKHKHKVCVRCSRPLCSSQKTDGNHHQPETLAVRPGRGGPQVRRPRQQRCPFPQDPTACSAFVPCLVVPLQRAGGTEPRCRSVG